VAAARERSSAEDVSLAAKPASEGGRWWLQSWFPDWSGWYGAQQLTEVQPPGTESSCVATDSEKALGNSIVLLYNHIYFATCILSVEGNIFDYIAIIEAVPEVGCCC